jgi:uncharacterized protein (DUF1800 family)
MPPWNRVLFHARAAALLLGLASTWPALATPPNLPPPRGHSPAPPWLGAKPDTAAAARFLAQTTFGPTDADITHLQAIGYEAWLAEQFNTQLTPPTREMDYLNWVTKTLDEPFEQNDRLEAWFLGALGGPDPQNNLVLHKDQLRQRVAFALSEIFVVSTLNTTIDQFPNGTAYYYDILINNAFGNYRQLLEQVTLSPAMGVYLNMLGNQRADSTQNIHPDENYAREVNQLFSVGLVLLNPDGTPQLVDGQPVPTYTQDTVQAFAHVFTGWNWSDCSADNFGGCGPNYTTGANFVTPMAAFEAYHDNGTHAPDDLPAKQLLRYPNADNGGVLVDGGTAASDLKFALDNIFNHPNVGPFLSRQLIEHLVTSNPSADYVRRVSSVFNDNGNGVRGDLQAVISAILLDSEARDARRLQSDSFGKLREPLLRLTHVWRAMGAQHTCGQNTTSQNDDGSTTTFHYAAQPYRYAGYNSTWGTDYYLGQTPLGAPSVFNFFRPDFTPPGEMTARSLRGPEFQINTDAGIVQVSNDAYVRSMYYALSDVCDSDDQFGDVRINLAQDAGLAGSGNGGAGDPADRLVDAYNTRFMAGQMSSFMRDILLGYLNPIDSTWVDDGTDWRLHRVRRALYLILTSPEYAIQK